MKRLTMTLAALAVFLFAAAASAAETKIFEKYESVRQALLKGRQTRLRPRQRRLPKLLALKSRTGLQSVPKLWPRPPI